MKIEGFSDLRYTRNAWTFFAISCNYRSGSAVIHLKEFNQSDTINRKKDIALNFPSFQMQRTNQLVLSNRDQTPYFQTDSFFIGNLAFIETGPFFTNKLESLWINYLNRGSYSYHGIIMELVFDVYQDNSSVTSTGYINDSFAIEGSYTPLFTIDNSKIGLRVRTNAQIFLGNVDFRNDDQIKSIVFLFQVTYQESLPNNFILVDRGVEGQDGHLVISLFKEDDRGRIIQLEATGKGNAVNWRSRSFIPPNTSFMFVIGLALSPANSARIAYYDTNG